MAVVPVKDLANAKSRLDVPPSLRRALVQAFLLDVLAALQACPAVHAVVLVTPRDSEVAQAVSHLGVQVVGDPRTGLVDAVAEGWWWAARTWPGSQVLAVPADLPALRPEHVGLVLERAADADRCFVPDRSATGTTLLVGRSGDAPGIAYGARSATRHRQAGWTELAGAPSPARHDVDTLEDLQAACALGLGRHTRRLVSGASQHALAGNAAGPAPRQPDGVSSVPC